MIFSFIVNTTKSLMAPKYIPKKENTILINIILKYICSNYEMEK